MATFGKMAEEFAAGMTKFFEGKEGAKKSRGASGGSQAVSCIPDPVSSAFFKEAMSASMGTMAEITGKHLAVLDQRTSALEAGREELVNRVNTFGKQQGESGALLQGQLSAMQAQLAASEAKQASLEATLAQISIDGATASTQELEQATAATKAELQEFRAQLQQEKDTATAASSGTASTVSHSKASLWVVIGGLGWDVPASQLRAAATNILVSAQISTDEYSCLSALAFYDRKGKGKGKGKGKASGSDADNPSPEPKGSMVELRFGTLAAAEDAVKKIRAVDSSQSSQRHWANFALTADAKASRLQIHRATDYLNGVFASQVPEGQEQAKWAQKIMPKLAIEVEGRVVASIYKGDLCMKPPAKEHLTPQEESDCMAAAQSAS